MRIFVTLLVAFIGGSIGIKLKIPAGALIGSMLLVAVFNIVSGYGELPISFKLVAQMVVGGMIGLSFTKESFVNMKNFIVPAFIMVLGLIFVSVLLGLIIYKFTDIDLVTALFAAAPGGMSDMAIISGEYGADQSIVVTMHLIRMITVILLLPRIIYILDKFI